MIVSCPSCTTKFNVPDAKVAGKRARMKCKRCGEAIDIDGTTLPSGPASARAYNPPSGPGSSRPFNDPPPKEPSSPGPIDISPRWRIALSPGKRNEVSFADLSQLYNGGALPAGALICAPGKTEFLPPASFPELERNTGRAVAALRLPQPTFTDETVALGAAETEVLKLQSRTPPLAPKRPPTAGFFDEGDVLDAMSSFDNLTSPRSSQSGPSASPSPQSSRPIRAPVAPSPYPIPRQGEVPPSSPFAAVAPRPTSSVPVAPPSSPVHSTPPPLSYSAPPPSSPLHSAPPPSGYAAPPAPPPSNPHHQAPVFAPAPLPLSTVPAPILHEPQWDADSSAKYSQSEQPHDFKAGRSSLWPMLLVSLLIAGGIIGVARYKPQWIAQGERYTKQLVERVRPPRPALVPVAKGPEFDTATAGLVLGQAAQDADKCKDIQGPNGKGRARVLFDPSGQAVSVMVSEPFHETPVGNCIVSRFLKAKVPAFGGQPVIVNKTFEIR